MLCVCFKTYIVNRWYDNWRKKTFSHLLNQKKEELGKERRRWKNREVWEKEKVSYVTYNCRMSSTVEFL